MTTGDYPVTAAMIAKSVNIMTERSVAELIGAGVSEMWAHIKSDAITLHGSDVATLTDDELQHVLLYKEV